MSIASCPITKHPWKKSGCPFALFYTLTRPLLSLLFSRLNSPSTLNLSSWVRCSIINLEELHCSFQRLSYTEELRNGHRTPHVASAVVTEGRDDIPQPGGYTLCNSACGTTHFLYQKGTLPAHVQIVHQDLFWKLFSSCATAIMCCCMGLFFPRCRTLRFPLWNFMRGVQVFGAEVALAASKEHDLMFLPHYLVVFIGVAPWLGRVKLSFSWCWREIFVRARIRADLHELCHGF